MVPVDHGYMTDTATTLLDTVLDVQSPNDEGADDMNEMNMPNPGEIITIIVFWWTNKLCFTGSIEHFEKLFYPKIPCKNCASCYETFRDEITWL